MTISISTVNVGVSANDGAGDNVRSAFIKVNNNLSNIKIGVDNLQATYANTSLAKVANLTVTNRVLGNVYFYGEDSIYINGSPVATSTASFQGGNVPLQANFTSAVSSTTTNTGAVVITGGLGIGENLNVGGIAKVNGNAVVASLTDSTDLTNAALIVKGGASIVKSARVGDNLHVNGSTDIAGTLSVSAITSLNSTETSINPATGALTVAGGAGIAGNLNTGGISRVGSDMFVAGNLYVTGSSTTGGQDLSIQDNLISLHTFANLAPLTYDDGKDIGFDFHFYKAGLGDTHAALVWANDTTALEYYSNGAEQVDGKFTGTYGTGKFGEFWSANTTPATSTTTGAIRTAGGMSAEGNLYIGGIANITGNATLSNTSITRADVTNLNSTGGSLNNTAIGSITPTTGKFTTITATVVNAATIGNVGASVVGTLQTASQPNVTGLGTLTGLSVSGTATLSGNTIVNNTLYGQGLYDNGRRVVSSVDWVAGSGIEITGETTTGPSASATIVNSGVTSLAAGGGIRISSSTGGVTVTNNGVTGITGTANQVYASSSTGGVTLSLPQSIGGGSSVQFGSLGIGTGASGTGGEIRATNNITAYYSDDRLKTRLGTIDNALDKIDQLTGFYYEANETAQALGYEVKREVGLSAQDTNGVMPEIVAPAPIDEKYLTIRYERFAPLLVEGIKELRKEIKAIKAHLGL